MSISDSWEEYRKHAEALNIPKKKIGQALGLEGKMPLKEDVPPGAISNSFICYPEYGDQNSQTRCKNSDCKCKTYMIVSKYMYNFFLILKFI